MVRVSAKDVDQHELVRQVAAFLKKSEKVKIPDWADVVKLGRAKELAPYDADWYYIRVASVVRHLYIRSPAGVGAFRKIYGSRKRNGTEPPHYCTASASVIRKCMHTLEALKWVEKEPTVGGRVISKQGRKDLDRIASQIKSDEVGAAASYA